MTGVQLSNPLSNGGVGQLKRRNHAEKWLLSNPLDSGDCPTVGKTAGQTGCNCPVQLSLYRSLRCWTAAQRPTGRWAVRCLVPVVGGSRATACETVGGASPPTTPGLAALAVPLSHQLCQGGCAA